MSSTVSTSDPSSAPSSSSAPMSSTQKQNGYDPATVQHALAITAVVVAPVIILMPPRKLDLYTFAAGGMGVYGANHLIRERHNGRGFMSVAGERFGFVPPSAKQQQQQQRTSDPPSSSSSSSPFFSSSSATTPSPASSLHTQPHHESPLERFSLPTNRARNIHESLAADREAATWRLERFSQLRKKAAALQREGWAVGSDMRTTLISARRQVEVDARRHGWPAPPALTDAEDKITRTGDLGLGWIKRQLGSGRGAHEKHSHIQVLASAVGAGSSSSSAATAQQAGVTGETWDGARAAGRESYDTTGLSGDEHREGGVAGMVRRVWMGEEKADWKERRLAEEQQALDEGKTYSDIILDQIWEVWNWDKRKDGEGNWVPKDK